MGHTVRHSHKNKPAGSCPEKQSKADPRTAFEPYREALPCLYGGNDEPRLIALGKAGLPRSARLAEILLTTLSVALAASSRIDTLLIRFDALTFFQTSQTAQQLICIASFDVDLCRRNSCQQPLYSIAAKHTG